MACLVHCPALASLGMFSSRSSAFVLVASPIATHAPPPILSLEGLWIIPPTSQPLPVSKQRSFLTCLLSLCLLRVLPCIVLGMQPALGRGHDLGQSSSFQLCYFQKRAAAGDTSSGWGKRSFIPERESGRAIPSMSILVCRHRERVGHYDLPHTPRM